MLQMRKSKEYLASLPPKLKIFTQKSIIIGKVKYLIYFGFIYQFIDLSRDYLEFDFRNEVNLKQYASLPAITFCLNRNTYQEEMIKRVNNVVLFRRHFCKANSSCYANKWSLVYLTNRKNDICFTYFYGENTEFVEVLLLLVFSIFGYNNVEIIIHPHYHPIHFERNSAALSIKKLYFVTFKEHVKYLLPYPYSTDCFDYFSNIAKKIVPRSQTECKLALIQKSIGTSCDHINYWNQTVFNDITEFSKEGDYIWKYLNKKYNDSYKYRHCNPKITLDKLNKMCKKQCRQSYYETKMGDYIKLNPGPDEFINVIINLSRANYYFNLEIILNPKMSFICYLSTLGGLISMWLGLSLFKISIGIIDKISKPIKNIIEFIVVKSIPLSWVKLLLKYLTIILFIFAMSYQNLDLINEYLKFKISIKLIPQEDFILPNIFFRHETAIDPKRDIVYEMGMQQLAKQFPSNSIIGLNDQQVYYYFEYPNIAFFNNYSKFIYSTHLNEFKFKCQIEFTNGKSILIRKSHFYISFSPFLKDNYMPVMHVHSSIFNSDKDFLSIFNISENIRLKKVLIQIPNYHLRTLISDAILITKSYIDSNIKSDFSLQSFRPGYNNIMSLDLNVHRRLYSNSNRKCRSDNQQGIFRPNFNEDLIDCYNYFNNLSLGCLPPGVIRPDRDFKQLGYRLCDYDFNMRSIRSQLSKDEYEKYESILQHCLELNQNDCEILNFKLHNTYTDKTRDGSTNITIIPKYSVNLNYQEQLSNSFMDLFYNCGGIVGMWFGWSILSVSTLITSIYNLMIKLTKNLKILVLLSRSYIISIRLSHMNLKTSGMRHRGILKIPHQWTPKF